MRNSISIIILAAFVILFSSLYPESHKTIEIAPTTSVNEVLKYFGEPAPNHTPDLSINGADAEKGKTLVLTGFAEKQSGGKTSKQSKHFVCTSCHNIEKDIPDLRLNDPQARLEYVKEKGLPFLQGTSLYGVVNRSSFYNGDYEKKYGDLVEPARNNLREAIQLCAVECSQGRKLKPWELESVLRYFWTLELKMGDLNLTDQDYQKLQNAASLSKGAQNTESIDFLKSFYQKGVPAHFVTPPEDRKIGAGLVGNPENGKLIYELSCLHCHENQRYSQFNLDDSKLSLNYLDRHVACYSRYSIYQVTRYGTSPLPGKRAYMPQYTMEKMSDQMLEDLRAYIQKN